VRTRSIPWLLALTACSAAPPSGPTRAAEPRPIPPSVDVTGTWNGHYEETACHSDVCQPCCSLRFKGGDPVHDFRLTLQQQHARVTGQYVTLPSSESVALLGGVVSGAVNGARFELVGKLAYGFSTIVEFSELRNFDADVDPTGRVAGGTFTLIDRRLEDGSEITRHERKILMLPREQGLD
jgi:hypothetical protein